MRGKGTGAAGQRTGDWRPQGWAPKSGVAWTRGRRKQEECSGQGLAREGNGRKGASASSAPCRVPQCVPCGLGLPRENLPAVSLGLFSLVLRQLEAPPPTSALS